ncbi:MAG TPA: hypothetical protein VIX61_11965 [Casimicrobiaceae bacterium]
MTAGSCSTDGSHRPRGAAARASIATVAFLALTSVACAQDAPGRLSADAAIGGYGLLRTDLDNGGDFEIGSVFARGSLGTAFNAQWSGELMLRYSYEDWNFSSPNALGPVGPWGAIQSPGVGFSLRYAHSENLVAFIGPQLDWNYESGASTADAQTYGATFGVTSVISPTLMLGIGGGVFRQINRTRFLPFVLVNWQIDDKWRLANPLQAGPTGGPGIELAYKISEQWEAAGGAAFRDERFRLRRDGPTPNGIGVEKGVPLFVRLTWAPSPKGKVDMYAGAVVGGELRVLDASGSTVSSSDFKTAPLLGITASLEF